MPEHFCTYFDHRYAAKGLAMWRSLKHHCPDATLHILCLNDSCLEILQTCGLQDVELYRLADVERAHPALLSARNNRSLIEYYFSTTPCLPLHVLDVHADIERLTYVDADLLFFADPQPVFDEVGDRSIGIIEHRFPPHLADLNKYGRFNVGWITFRNDHAARSCLETWRDQCLEWCYDRVEEGRFAEQRYLDAWPATVPPLTIVRHKGANVAPWNLGSVQLSFDGRGLTLDGEPLLFFHAHGFQIASPGQPRVSNLERYGVPESSIIEQALLTPYEAAVTAALADIARPLAAALLADQSRDTNTRLEHVAARTAHLEAYVATIEADREARLDVIRRLEGESIEARTSAQALSDDLASVRSGLQAMERSRSWRWTRPIRWIAGLFRSQS